MSVHKNLVACPCCDALYQKENLSRGQVLVCDICQTVIDDGFADFRRTLSYALSALILFVISNTFPFISINLKGEHNTISIYSSIEALFNNDLSALALIIIFLIVIIPLWYLSAIIFAIISFQFGIKSNFTRKFLHLIHIMSPWNMLEVYLISVLVTLVKLMQMAEITFEISFWTFLVLIIFSILMTKNFDLKDAIFLINNEQKY